MTDVISTVVFRIHHAPKETCELFRNVAKRFDKLEKEEKGYKSFRWSCRKDGFQSFSGEIFSQVLKQAEKIGLQDITLIKAKSKIAMGFMGNPEKLKETLEKILEGVVRREKLKPFK